MKVKFNFNVSIKPKQTRSPSTISYTVVEAKVEGVKRNNFFGTYLLGPFLISNPLFTKELMKKLGVENPVLPFEEDIMEAYNVRLEELNDDIIFN